MTLFLDWLYGMAQVSPLATERSVNWLARREVGGWAATCEAAAVHLVPASAQARRRPPLEHPQWVIGVLWRQTRILSDNSAPYVAL